jgi:hypothetical protein
LSWCGTHLCTPPPRVPRVCHPLQPIGNLSSNPDDRAPHAHSINSANMSEWLQHRTSALDDPRLWTTLPPVQHAPGCEQYTAVMAAEGGFTQQQQQGPMSAGSGGAHEAGFDAFMTGVVFLGLCRLYEITGNQQCLWCTRSTDHVLCSHCMEAGP